MIKDFLRELSYFQEVRPGEMYSILKSKDDSTKGEYIGTGVVVAFFEDRNKRIKDKYVLLRKEDKPVCYRFQKYRISGTRWNGDELNIINSIEVLLGENGVIADKVLSSRGL